MARIARVGHVVLNVKDTIEAIDWYTNALGMELMNHDQGMDMAFLSFGESDHDIALIKVPEGVETGSPGCRTPRCNWRAASRNYRRCSDGLRTPVTKSTSLPTTA